MLSYKVAHLRLFVYSVFYKWWMLFKKIKICYLVELENIYLLKKKINRRRNHIWWIYQQNAERLIIPGTSVRWQPTGKQDPIENTIFLYKSLCSPICVSCVVPYIFFSLTDPAVRRTGDRRPLANRNSRNIFLHFLANNNWPKLKPKKF
jgi:hypothetical protein